LVEKLELIITLPFLPKVNTIKVDMVDEFTWWNYIYIYRGFFLLLSLIYAVLQRLLKKITNKNNKVIHLAS
jgi:hypothetical protein